MGNVLPVSIHEEGQGENDGRAGATKEPASNDLIYVSRQWKALFESAEHQTRAALMILESKDTPTPKKQTKTATKSTKLPEMHPHISKEKVNVLKEQLKGLKKTHQGMKNLVNTFIKDQGGKDIPELDAANEKDESSKSPFSMEEIESLQTDNERLQEENMKLKQQLHVADRVRDSSDTIEEDMEYQNSGTERVQLLIRHEKEQALMDSMIAALLTKLESDGRQLSVEVLKKQSDVRQDNPCLVPCITASRLGTDIVPALKGLTLNNKLGLIVLHPRAPHAPAVESSEKRLSSPEYKGKRPENIFDMSFLPARGIYKCDMNDKAINVIADFIKSNQA